MTTYANGTAALQFPSSYTLLDAEEMEYVDGGFYIDRNKCITIGAYVSQLTGFGTHALAVMALGTLAAKLGGKVLPIVNKVTGLSITAKIIGVALTTIAIIEFASFCNGILGAKDAGTGVSMQWKGVFTNKKYY